MSGFLISKESKDRDKRVIKDIIIKNLFKEEKKIFVRKKLFTKF